MAPGPEEYDTVEVRLPADLFADLDAYAVAHGYASVDEAVADALDKQTDDA
jgi:hypothetical protein